MIDGAGIPVSLKKLVRELSKLPTIGQKSATRLAYHLINNDPELIDSLSMAMKEAKSRIKLCQDCHFLTEDTQCVVCSSTRRNSSLVCVVEKPVDVIAIERAGGFDGLYHVLHGLWAPLRGMGPDSIKLAELVTRVEQGGISEIILATSATVEGDATASFISKQLEDLPVRITRLAQGLPKGGELEYADDVTLTHAFRGRKSVGR